MFEICVCDFFFFFFFLWELMVLFWLVFLQVLKGTVKGKRGELNGNREQCEMTSIEVTDGEDGEEGIEKEKEGCVGVDGGLVFSGGKLVGGSEVVLETEEILCCLEF
jgi:hypothetical protein